MVALSAVTSRDLTLLVHDEADRGSVDVLAGIDASVADGLARPFLRLAVGRDDGDADPVRWSGVAVGPDGLEPIDRIFDRVARARGASTVQLVGLLTRPRDGAMAGHLDDALERMRVALERLLGHGMRCIPARVALLGYGEGMVDERYFSSPDARNLAVIPLDRADDRSAARPIERSDASAFRDHGAIELMTICGLWSSVASGPLPDLPLTPASGGAPQVRLVQSSVRFLRTPPIPARELVDRSRELPLPELFMPANDPGRRLSDLFAQVRAEELDYRVAEPPALRRFTMGPLRLLRMTTSDSLGVLRELPRIVLRTIRGEVAVVSQGVARRTLGEDSQINVQLDRAVERAAADADSLDADAFADEVDGLLRRSELQFVDPVPGDIWTRLSGRILGVFDGDPEVAPLRQAALGDPALLVTERQVATGGVDWGRLWSEGRSDDPVDLHGPSLRFEPSDDLLAAQVKEDTGWVSDLFDLDSPELAAEAPEPEQDPPDPFAVEGADDEYASEDRALVELGDISLPEVIDAPHHGLLLRVLTDLRRQRREATLDVRRLVEMALRRGADQPLEVKTWVPGFAVAGVALVLLVLGTSDLANRFATSTGWLLWARDALFIVGTVAIVFLALGVSTLLDRMPGGTKNIVLMTGGLASALGLILFREPIRAELSRATLESNTVGVVAGVLVVTGVVGAIYQARSTGDASRIDAARLLGALAVVYGFLAVVSVQALDGSLIRGLEDETRMLFRILVGFTGTVLFLTSIFSLVVRRFAAARRWDRLAHERAWAAEQLASALEARTRLQTAEWQWIGTATVLARLIDHPFGVAGGRLTGPVAEVEDPDVLKGSRATLSLTNSGREAIDAKLRSILVGPSWLRQQYELLVAAYREVLARRTGSAVSDLQDRRPEQDSYAPRMESFDDTLLRGDRWEFARRVAGGEFDNRLAHAADSLDLEEVYGPLLAESGAMILEEEEEEGSDAGTVRDFIHRILPVEVPRLPIGLTDVLFSGGDPRRDMATWVWWPEGLLGELPTSPWTVAPTRFVRERSGGALVVSVVRLDVSEPFRHDACFVPPQATAAPTDGPG